MKRRKFVRKTFIGLAVILAIVVIGTPFLRVDRFREPIRMELEQALDREVEINGPVRLRLWPSPGLSLTSVVIHDDPALSREPIAYVSELGVGISPWRLPAGTIQFDSLRLIRPSVNLVKAPEGGWNYPGLIERTFRSSGDKGTALPRIEVRSGRLNFRFTDLKSVFYLSDADVDIYPEEAEEPTVRFRFSGSPSRTDRAAQGFGTLSGNGRYVNREAEDHLRFVVRLERSAIPDILTLLKGHGAGLGGFLASRAVFEGPPSGLSFTGDLQLADIDRRFLQPSGSGEWALNYHGRLDMVKQVLELDTAPGEQKLPVTVRLRVGDYLSRPRWALFVAADQLRIETLPALGREMGLPVPAVLRPGGTLSGGLALGGHEGMRGGFQMQDFTLLGADGTALRFEPVSVTIDPERWHAEPVRIETGPNASMRLGATLQESDRLELRLQTDRLNLDAFRTAWVDYTNTGLPPALEDWQGGHWSGELVFRASREGTGWSGDVAVEDATLAVAGLAQTVRVDKAATDANRERVELTGSAGEQAFVARMSEGELSLEFEKLNGPALEELLEPALSWQRGFLERALRIGSGRMPAWLRTRRLAGEIRAGVFQAPPVILTGVAGRFLWDGPSVTLYLDEARANSGAVSGRLITGMHTGRPHYVMDATIAGYPWEGGLLQAAGTLAASGSGLGLLASASAAGLFTLEYRGPGPQGAFDRASGSFQLRAEDGKALIEFPFLEVKSGDLSYGGSGRLSGLNRIELELFGDRGWSNAGGSLRPFRLDLEDALAGRVE